MEKLLIYGAAPWEREYLESRLKTVVPDVALAFNEKTVSPTHIPTEVDATLCSIFVDSKIDETVLAALPQLKFIATRSTGYDHVDLAATTARNITVSSVPSYGENTVAEFAFALLLMVSRKMYEAVRRVRDGSQFNYEGLQGFDLKGRTIGVVGTGRIGRHIMNMAKGFGMTIVGYDPYPNEALAKEVGFTYLSLEELLKVSDVVTLHVPYLPSTHHIINAAALALMKPTAVLINTSRGAVIDTTALAVALKEGKLGGAGLDVIEEEGAIKDEAAFLRQDNTTAETLRTVLADHILMDLPNVVVTPHAAFNTREALQRILDTTIENIVGFVKGAPVNVVKP